MAVSGLRTLFGRFWEQGLAYTIGGSASAAIDPVINPLVEEAWSLAVAAGDSRAINPADLANMVVQGVLEEDEAAHEAAKSGMSRESFHRLVRVAGEPPGPQQLLDLWDRGDIKEADVRRGLLQSRLKPEWVNDYMKLQRQLLTAAELAEMVVQGVLSHEVAEQRARQVSIEPADFALMVRLAGSPPGPETLIELWNRGEINEADVRKGLLQSRLKPEWVDDYMKLRRNPPTLGAIVAAAIKERITMAEGAALAAEHGTDAKTFAMLVDEGGRPMAEGQALTLVRRGEMTEAQFHEVIARSNVKTQYAPFLLKLRTNLPSLFQIKQMLSTGAIDDALARDVLSKEGYSPDLVNGVIAAGHGTKLAGSKNLAQSAIIAAYTNKQMSAADATNLLQGLGYDKNDSGLLLGLADYNRAHTMRSAVVAVVKARFLQRDIDDATATTLLDKAGIAADERDQYLTLWSFDRDANPRLLTVADLNAAYKKGFYTQAEYKAYLPRLGFQEPEISLLVKLHASG